mmetsp:Transcript_15100/g.23017  ORF Transcript_15100/g.23017 Transcript_15100/m.23017 type:complete len:462 (+) Transcript_15100:72-1457(+)
MILFTLLHLSPLLVAACPFNDASNNDKVPLDEHHRHLRRGQVGETKRRFLQIIAEQEQRSLQSTCMTQSVYNDIHANVAAMGNAIPDAGDRGHFWGGIVRLAAHDFMDFDLNFSGEERLGSDGCLEFDNGANAGLDDIWCDSCALKQLYDTSYSSFISRADFWVAAANGVVAETSDGLLNLPFRWGRLDRNVCPLSSGRLPEASGCTEVEETFINRMGVTWKDAVALMGAHTLGRGHTQFSGHDGTWVETDEDSTVFDTGFFTETVNRPWRPRGTAVGTDWTWGNDRDVMMLNTDICLRFDIPDGDDQECCTNTERNCGPTNLPQCESSQIVRPQAFEAFEEFAGRDNNANIAFYSAFSEAWQKATENGYAAGSLNDLEASCDVDPTFGPTPNPTLLPTPSATLDPTANPTPFPTLGSDPTAAPTRGWSSTRRPTRAPTRAPTRRPRRDGSGGGSSAEFWA